MIVHKVARLLVQMCSDYFIAISRDLVSIFILHRQGYSVHYWPSLVDESKIVPLDEDTTVFSLSKLAGYASQRMGWAWVKDSEIVRLMNEYISLTTQVSFGLS